MALRRSLLLCFLAAVLAQVCAADPSSIFRHGIMSGDPTPDAVILWTRVTVSESANVQVGWRVSETNRFLASSSPAVLMEGVATTGADVDFTVHVDVTGLSPYTHYYYVFYYDDPSTGEIVYSTIGRTMTSPALGQSVESLKMGVASCAHWLWGYFHPYAALAEVEDLDIVIFLGDYIYEYGNYTSPQPVDQHVRQDSPLEPWGETVTLDDYRKRYALYHTDDALQTLHARVPVGLVKWDDHEFCNDPHPNLAGAQNHQELCTNENGARPGDPDFVPNVETVFTGQPPCDKDEGDWLVRVNAATKAFYEWMPIRYSQATFEDPVLRRERSQEFHWGNLVDGYSPEEVLNAACEDEGCGCEELSPLSTSSLFFQLVYITTDPSQYVPGTEFYNYLAFSLQEHAACITSSLRRKLSEEDVNRMAQVFAASSAAGHPWQVYFAARLYGGYHARDFYRAAGTYDGDTGDYIDYINNLVFFAEPFFRLEYALSLFNYSLDTSSWDGYLYQRAVLAQVMQSTAAQLVVISGDSHDPWAYELVNPLDGTPLGVEFSTPSVTSIGLEDISVPYWDAFEAGSLDPAQGFSVADTAALFGNPELRYSRQKDSGVLVVTANRTHLINEFVYITPDPSLSHPFGKESLRNKKWDGRYTCDAFYTTGDNQLHETQCVSRIGAGSSLSCSLAVLGVFALCINLCLRW